MLNAAPDLSAAPGGLAPTHRLSPTPSQTVGPFYGYALPFAGGPDAAAIGHPQGITVQGCVYDGAGQPIPDALLEFWQAAPDGSLAGAPGSLRRDPVTGAVIGRDHVRFTGFARVTSDADGRYVIRTLAPRPIGRSAPYLAVCIFARGLLHHLFSRVYFADVTELNASDPLLASLDPARRATLVAHREPGLGYRFDVRLQRPEGSGDAGVETVFLEFTDSTDSTA
jgi:protocatechuate 3,4-dioxygenase alpha subunit